MRVVNQEKETIETKEKSQEGENDRIKEENHWKRNIRNKNAPKVKVERKRERRQRNGSIENKNKNV